MTQDPRISNGMEAEIYCLRESEENKFFGVFLKMYENVTIFSPFLHLSFFSLTFYFLWLILILFIY